MITVIGTILLGDPPPIEVGASTTYFLIENGGNTLRPVGSNILLRPEAIPTELGLWLTENQSEETCNGGLDFPSRDRVRSPEGFRTAYFYNPDNNTVGWGFKLIGAIIPNYYDTLDEALDRVI